MIGYLSIKMPQVFQVLRCYKCLIFQVHQTKKSNKWNCKVCGEKQSVKRHYGIGTAKDCRMHVQKLNNLRGDKEENKYNYIDSENSESEENVETVSNINTTSRQNNENIKNQSKWLAYVEKEQFSEVNEQMYLDSKEVVLELPQKRKRKQNNDEQKFAKISNFNGNTSSSVHASLNNGHPISNQKNKIEIDDSNVSNSFEIVREDVTSQEISQFIHSISPSLNSENNRTQNDYDKESDFVKIKNVELPSQVNVTHQDKKCNFPVNRESKWAQFINEDEIIKDENTQEIESANDFQYYNNDQDKAELCNIYDHQDIVPSNDYSVKDTNSLKRKVKATIQENREKDKDYGVKDNSKTKVQSGSETLFSLCDDGDIDNILDF